MQQQRLRAIRSDIFSVYGALGLSASLVTPGDMASQCERLIGTLSQVKELADLVSNSPVAQATVAAAESTEPDSLEKHFEELDYAIERCERRAESKRLLLALVRWFRVWLDQRMRETHHQGQVHRIDIRASSFGFAHPTGLSAFSGART